MREEYDFTGGVRGRHHKSIQTGYTVTIHRTDGTKEIRDVKPQEGAVVLAPDVLEYFPDSESVNATLRSLMNLIPKKRHPARKRA